MANRRSAQKALEQHGSELRSKPNVVGLGIRPAADGSGETLAVYVSKKAARESLAPEDRLPESVAIESKSGTELIPVQVFQLDNLKNEIP
jgi:hypothetical protein